MEDLCPEGTDLPHIQDLSTSGHIPQVRNELITPIDNHRNKQNSEF
jgi:hypothetical protein